MKSAGKRKIAVLGEMNELGDSSAEMHYDVGRFTVEAGVDIVIAVGEKAKDIARGANDVADGKKDILILECRDADDAYEDLTSIVQEGDLLLVKASRAMELDKLVKKFESLN